MWHYEGKVSEKCDRKQERFRGYQEKESIVFFYQQHSVSIGDKRSDQITVSPKIDQSGAVVVFTSAFCGKA